MKFYRYEQVEYAEQDYEGEYCAPSYPNPKLELREFSLYKETEKGYWIGYGDFGRLHSKGRWISKTSRKRFAYPTKEEAINNFILRTTKRKKILKWQIRCCEITINLAEEVVKTFENNKKN